MYPSSSRTSDNVNPFYDLLLLSRLSGVSRGVSRRRTDPMVIVQIQTESQNTLLPAHPHEQSADSLHKGRYHFPTRN